MSSDVNLVKAPNKTQSFTRQQMLEFAACCDPETGCEYFMRNFFYIQHPVRGKMLFEPYDYQIGLINTYVNYRKSIAMLPRQCGKSTCAAGYILWYSMFIADSTILIAAHVGRGSAEIMERVRFAYESCPDHIRAGAVSYNKLSTDFDNGSKIRTATTTENTGRGMSISLLYLDEFSFVRPTIANLFWASISPTLATGGKCIITSTPNSDEDLFADLWRGANKCQDAFGNPTDCGVNGFKAYSAHWSDHPDRDQQWADEMREQLGEEKFMREIECRFVLVEETLISALKLMNMTPQDPIRKQGEIRWYETPRADSIYVVGWDPAVGTGGDAAAIQVFDATSHTQVAEWRHNRTTIPEQCRIMVDIVTAISVVTGKPDQVYYSVENNTVGEAALMSINHWGEENIPGYFLSEQGRKRKGFTTTNRNKMTACTKLKTMIENDKLTVRSKPLLSELKTYVRTGGSYAAKLGETDDLVAATLIVIRMLIELQQYHREVDLSMRDHLNDVEMPLPFVKMSSPYLLY